jgi:hypothetical protein
VRPQSCKAKGRRFQQQICADLLAIGQRFGLEPDDIQSRSMGANGVDVILSPAARRLLGLLIEAKNVEALNVVGVFQKHLKAYETTPGLKLLVHTRNRTEPMVTLRWQDFLSLLEEKLNAPDRNS